MSHLVRRKLSELLTRFGRDLGDDPRRCEGLLRDVCGDHKREIFVLVSAAREGVPSELMRSSKGVPKEVALARMTKRLHDNLGIAENLARWGVESWALALGIASTKDFRFPFKCPGCGAAGTIATRLAGQKIRCPKCKAVLCISNDGRRVSVESVEPVPAQPMSVSSPETVSAQSAVVTVALPTPLEEDDLLSEFPRVSAEDMLRQTIRRVLADGIVTETERAEIKHLCAELGIGSDVASRVVAEVKSELGIAASQSNSVSAAASSASPIGRSSPSHAEVMTKQQPIPRPTDPYSVLVTSDAAPILAEVVQAVSIVASVPSSTSSARLETEFARKKIPAGICAILLGSLGIHKFILGLNTAGIIMLAVTVATCGYAAVVFTFVGIAEGIIYMTKTDHDFYQRYAVEKKGWF